MSGTDRELERECRVFTRYLAGREPTPYVIAKYRAAHAAGPAYRAQSAFDARLVAGARLHPVLAWLVDAAARFTAPRGLLRKKLVLLLAILETAPPFYTTLERLQEGRGAREFAGLALGLVLFVPGLALGMVLVLVLRVVPLGGGRP